MDRNCLIKKRSNHGGDIYSDPERDWLDLSANINPRPFPKGLYEALPGILEEARAYPDIEYQELREDLAAYAGRLTGSPIDPAWIIPGNGAVEILDKSISGAHRALIVQPCFSEYELSCLRHGIPYEVLLREPSEAVCLEDDFFDLLDIRVNESIQRKERIDLVVLCNPNNPDGKYYDRNAFESFLRGLKGSGVRIMVDETFGEYLEEDKMLLSLVTDHEDLLIVKAMTKFFGLPGVRLGYGITRTVSWKRAITDRLTTWNVGAFDQRITRLLVKEEKFIEGSRNDNRETRQYLFEALGKTGHFDVVYPSSASFIMVYRENMAGLLHELKLRGILLRDLINMAGLGPGYARIAVKDRSHADALLRALADMGRG